MPNGRWQKVREYAVHLPAMDAGAVPAVGQTPQNPTNDGIKQVSDLLKGFLGGK